MTTVWEPDLDELRAIVAELEGRASEEEGGTRRSGKGTKRKRLQGVQRLSARERRRYCKECGGSQICEHGRVKQGVRWWWNLRARSCAALVRTGRGALRWAICEHGRAL